MNVDMNKLNAYFDDRKKKVDDELDRELLAAKNQPTKELRAAAERIAWRHYEDATKGFDGIVKEHMKVIGNILEKGEKQ